MFLFSKHLLLVLAGLAALSACATVKRLTPMPSFSTLKKVTSILPGMPASDKAAADDPQVPFNSRGTLGYGHTLRLDVYEGSRSTKRIFSDVAMIDTNGVIDFGKVGSAKIGGATLPEAVEALAATFRIGLRVTRPVTVHVLSVEDVPLVFITGDVIKDEFIPAWDDMTIKQAVTVAGGRKLDSTKHGVYVIREGNRRYYSSLEAANEDEPEAGDIIYLSPDI